MVLVSIDFVYSITASFQVSLVFHRSIQKVGLLQIEAAAAQGSST